MRKKLCSPVRRVASAPVLQPKLTVNQPGDAYEREANAIADEVMRMPGGDVRTGQVMRMPNGDVRTGQVMRMPGGGVHAGDIRRMPNHDGEVQRKCAQCEEEDKGKVQRKESGDEAQAVQSKESGGGAPAVSPAVHETLASSGQPLDSSNRSFMEARFGHDFGQVRIHNDTKAAESARQINALAYTSGNHIVMGPSVYSPQSPNGRRLLAHELTHTIQQGGRSSTVMRLTPDEFRRTLGANADQKTAIDALFADKTFLSLWNYLRDCPIKDKKDLGPLTLKVTPGLKMYGAERYGGYFPGSKTLEINPTKPEHLSNPTELVDTIVHEMIHAVDDLQKDCKAAGAADAPLAGAGTATDRRKLAEVKGTPDEDKLMIEQGPGASNPCEEFIDINKAAQQMIIQILKNNIKVAKVGKPTITFVNDILRSNPDAMKQYKACRDVACAKADPAEKSKAIGQCSADILAKFVNPPPPATNFVAPPAAGVNRPSPPPPKSP